MDDRSGACHHLFQKGLVQDRTFDDRGADTVEVLPEAERHVVQHDRLRNLGYVLEVTDQVGTDEAGTTGHDDLHRSSITMVCRLRGLVCRSGHEPIGHGVMPIARSGIQIRTRWSLVRLLRAHPADDRRYGRLHGNGLWRISGRA